MEGVLERGSVSETAVANWWSVKSERLAIAGLKHQRKSQEPCIPDPSLLLTGEMTFGSVFATLTSVHF